ncbi:hypothetical protein [Novipirellula rosea]
MNPIETSVFDTLYTVVFTNTTFNTRLKSITNISTFQGADNGWHN